MNKLLWSIIRAAHCRNTHQYFAIDALPMVQTDAGMRLVGHLLRHPRRYLAGAKDPDRRFRDYQNHVVHVNEGYWGGAPRVAHQWYDRLLRYLRSDRFADAAHAAGVLSHYFTDPFQPLHTQSSDREAVLHRPFEWSVTTSYDAILDCWREDHMRVVFSLSDRPEWLGEAILHGARFANRKYEWLLEHFDLSRAVKHPSQGLTVDVRTSMAEVFGIAITGWARVLERTALDAETTRRSELPRAGTVWATIDSAWHIPIGLWKRRGAYRREQRAVEALYDEFLRLGRLQEHLPAEVDVVRRVVQVHRQEQQWKQYRLAQRASSGAIKPTAQPETHESKVEVQPATLPLSKPSEALSPQRNQPRRRAA